MAAVEVEASEREERSKRYEETNGKIREAFLQLLNETGRAPTISEIAQRVELSRATCQEHVRGLSYKATAQKYRILTDDVVDAIRKAATLGDMRAAKLWFQVVEGWSESLNLKGDGLNQKQKIVVTLKRREEAPVEHGA